MAQKYQHNNQKCPTKPFIVVNQPNLNNYPIPHSYAQSNGYVPRPTRSAVYYSDVNDTENFSEDSDSFCSELGNCDSQPSMSDTRLAQYGFSDTSISSRFTQYGGGSTRSCCSGRPSERSSKRSNFSRPSRYSFPQNDVRNYPVLETSTGEESPEADNCESSAIPVSITPISMVSNQTRSSQQTTTSSASAAQVPAWGGRCQTCERICHCCSLISSAMGILVGFSLCVAGAILRTSAARNLQVLVFIGLITSVVSFILLTVLCRSEKNRRNVKKKQSRKSEELREYVVLDARVPSTTPDLPVQQQLKKEKARQGQPQSNHAEPRARQSVYYTVSEDVVQIEQAEEPQRSEPQQVQRVLRPFPQQTRCKSTEMIDQPGVPWWRRKNLPDTRYCTVNPRLPEFQLRHQAQNFQRFVHESLGSVNAVDRRSDNRGVTVFI